MFDPLQIESRASAPTASAPDHQPPGTGWTERIRAGDHEAFAALFLAFYPGMCAFVSRRVGSEAIAEELVQDVFLRIWERREMLDPGRSLAGYVCRAAKNQVINHLKHREITSRSHDMLVISVPTSADLPEEDARYTEMTTAARTAIDGLPPRCREIFLLSRQAELTYGEIARMLGISIKTVETQMGRALRSLRSRLGPFLGPE